MVQQDNGPCMSGSSLVLPPSEPHPRKSRASFVSQPFKLTEQCTCMQHPVQGMELKQGQDTSRETPILLTQRRIFLPNLKVKRENLTHLPALVLLGFSVIL